eukprot:12834040-Alexandrium_andersonii.AAC.1
MGLDWFDPFYERLENTPHLLCNDQRRNRFVATCLHTSRYASASGKFENKIPGLYEKRWAHLIHFTKACLIGFWVSTHARA